MTADELLKRLCQNLRTIREIKGLSQSEVGRRMGVPASYVCDMERGAAQSEPENDRRVCGGPEDAAGDLRRATKVHEAGDAGNFFRVPTAPRSRKTHTRPRANGQLTKRQQRKRSNLTASVRPNRLPYRLNSRPHPPTFLPRMNHPGVAESGSFGRNRQGHKIS